MKRKKKHGYIWTSIHHQILTWRIHDSNKFLWEWILSSAALHHFWVMFQLTEMVATKNKCHPNHQSRKLLESTFLFFKQIWRCCQKGSKQYLSKKNYNKLKNAKLSQGAQVLPTDIRKSEPALELSCIWLYIISEYLVH